MVRAHGAIGLALAGTTAAHVALTLVRPKPGGWARAAPRGWVCVWGGGALRRGVAAERERGREGKGGGGGGGRRHKVSLAEARLAGASCSGGEQRPGHMRAPPRASDPSPTRLAGSSYRWLFNLVHHWCGQGPGPGSRVRGGHLSGGRPGRPWTLEIPLGWMSTTGAAAPCASAPVPPARTAPTGCTGPMCPCRHRGR